MFDNLREKLLGYCTRHCVNQHKGDKCSNCRFVCKKKN